MPIVPRNCFSWHSWIKRNRNHVKLRIEIDNWYAILYTTLFISPYILAKDAERKPADIFAKPAYYEYTQNFNNTCQIYCPLSRIPSRICGKSNESYKSLSKSVKMYTHNFNSKKYLVSCNQPDGSSPFVSSTNTFHMLAKICLNQPMCVHLNLAVYFFMWAFTNSHRNVDVTKAHRTSTEPNNEATINRLSFKVTRSSSIMKLW